MSSNITIKLSKNFSRDLLSNYQSKSKIIKKIATYIDRCQYFLLTTHIRSDADGVGSQIGLYYLLKKLKKKCWVLNNEPPGEKFISHLDHKVVDDINSYNDQESWLRMLSKMKPYFVFILDSSEIERSGRVGEAFSQSKCSYATIDHHVLKPKKNYCIDSSYAATCEIIWDLYRYFKIPIPTPAALSLYIGLIADSGNFRFNKTSFRTHLAGADLISTGIDTDGVYRLLYEDFPIDRLFLLKRIFKTVKINSKLGYVIGEILPKTKRGLELGDSSTEGIVNQLLAAKGVYIAALASKTDEGHLKCSLRSIGDTNVAKIAQEFGGGGHNNASGLKISERYTSAKKKLISSIEKNLKSPKDS